MISQSQIQNVAELWQANTPASLMHTIGLVDFRCKHRVMLPFDCNCGGSECGPRSTYAFYLASADPIRYCGSSRLGYPFAIAPADSDRRSRRRMNLAGGFNSGRIRLVANR
ncbi:hypothetical protein A0H81_11290 [Grifola frondosa]|uniref:Uncharacterized protein n=1 Tax=Grifola frondosa TaxID=5627 RepID=A0A1C7LXZ8_GRIFR|nr:hypothetical protein A0H81_11290 [Grifola frondosa]